MSIVRLENVYKALGGLPVLEAADFRVEPGEKIGLIGRNGAGKTTLFRLILGEMEPDQGVIERMRRARMAHLAQKPDIETSATILDTVMGLFAELVAMERELEALEQALAAGDEAVLGRYGALQETFTHAGGYEFRTTAKRVLHGLGFRADEFHLPVHVLSGGQRTRLMLALVLLQDADLLLLDEPENHLDIEAREWLETFLRDCPQAVVIISHDRRMLNHVTTRIVEVERARLTGYAGNYEYYAAQKALAREQQEKAFTLQQQRIEKEQKFINRFRYTSTKARQVQSRIKRLEKLERVEEPLPEASAARFRFGEVVRSGQWVLEGRDLSMAYGPLRLYEGFSFQMTRGERVGIIGPNGSGKTTLLRHLAGRLAEGRGAVALGHQVRLGFYDQHHENLDGDGDIMTEIRRLRPDMTPEQVRTFMGGFLFTGDDVFKPLGVLSGGESSRVALAKLVLGSANLLLLDEPTNHLDIASREALEASLGAFPGALLMVTHDRELIDRLVDRLIVFENGQATLHLGNYSDYRERVEARRAAPAAASPGSGALKIRKGNRRNHRTEERDARRKQKRLDELEGDIEALEEVIHGVEQQFLALDAADHRAFRALQEEYDGLKQDLQALYAEWERMLEEDA